MSEAAPLFLNLAYFYNLIYQFLRRVFDFSWWSAVWPYLAGVSLFFEIALFVGIVILLYRIFKLRQKDIEEDKVLDYNLLRREVMPRNEQWEKIIRRIDSDHPAEWKLAVMEADNLLDELVKRFPGAVGENLGERLKSIEPSDFKTLDDAWEAHKIRNQIAHETDYTLSKREARETIERFRRVFEEFDYI